ncbi:MAG TPA: helix-hairpin-helix domain-containing protein, partial [Methanocorpusculum sp.]|nr:helix-hairpin-helix domain-containing protein [Methanocorpusculum sp.]
EEFFAAVKTAAVVEEWASEISEEMISERFGVGGGDIHAAVENLKWLLHAAKRIAHEFAPSLEKEMSILEMRVANGVKEELIPLISLKGIGRVRARRLFSRGITNHAELLAADKADLVSVLGSVTTENVLKEAKRKGGVKTERDEELDEVMEKKEEVLEQTKTDTKKQPTLFDF